MASFISIRKIYLINLAKIETIYLCARLVNFCYIANRKDLYLEHQVVVIIFSIGAGEPEVAIGQAVHFETKQQVERLSEFLTSLLEGFYQSLALQLLRFQLALQICSSKIFVTHSYKKLCEKHTADLLVALQLQILLDDGSDVERSRLPRLQNLDSLPQFIVGLLEQLDFVSLAHLHLGQRVHAEVQHLGFLRVVVATQGPLFQQQLQLLIHRFQRAVASFGTLQFVLAQLKQRKHGIEN